MKQNLHYEQGLVKKLSYVTQAPKHSEHRRLTEAFSSAEEETMRTKSALPLALGIALAIPASAYAALGASRPAYTHRVIHHSSVVARAEVRAPAPAYAPARPTLL